MTTAKTAHSPTRGTPAQGATATYLGSFVGLGVATLLLGPSLETFRALTGTTKGTIGLLFTATAIGYLVGSLIVGRVIARRPAHWALAGGLLMVALSVVVIPFERSLLSLALAQALLGFGSAWIDVCGNSLVLWVHRGGPIMNALHLCFAVGATLAPVIVSRSLAWTDGLRAGYLVVAVGLVLSAAIVLRHPSPPNPHDELEARLTRQQRLLAGLGVLFFVAYVGVELGFSGWIFEYGVARGLSHNGAATWLGTAFLGSFMIGRLLSIPLARRVQPYRVLLVDLGVCIGALGLLLVGAEIRATMWVGTIIFGLGTASMFPTMLSLMEPHVPSTGAVTGAYLAGSAAGSMTVPWLIGRLLDSTGPSAMPEVVLAGTVITGAVVIAFQRLAGRRANWKSAGPSLTDKSGVPS